MPGDAFKKPGRKKAPVTSKKTEEEKMLAASHKTDVFETEQTDFYFLNFDQENLLQGFIFSEILGKPRSKRRAGW